MARNRNRNNNKDKTAQQKAGATKEYCKDKEIVQNTKSFEKDGFRPKEFNAQKSSSNDPRWYAENEQLLKDSASFSYNYPLGARINLGPNAGTVANSTSIPGVMAIYCTPSVGYSTDPNSPVNIAARNIYTFVRHANAGHTNYESTDLMLYLLAQDSCYSFIAHLKRLYGVMLTYSYTNRYYAMSVIQALGANFNDLDEHIADLRAYINSLVVRVGSMCVPASMSYMARHIWMYSGMYVDTPNNDKAQTYVYVPEAFYQFGLDNDGAGCLYLQPLAKEQYTSQIILPTPDNTVVGNTFAQLKAYGDQLLAPILMNEDFNIMSGDILKAFGENGVYMIESLPENYIILPTYSEEVLNQINNATLIGRGFDPVTAWKDIDNPKNNPYKTSLYPSGNYIWQVKNVMGSYLQHEPYRVLVSIEDLSAPAFKVAYTSVQGSNKLVNFEHGNITPADTMVATRMTNISTGTVTQSSLSLNSSWVSRDLTPDTYDTIYLTRANYQTVGSDTANYAKIFYWALPNRGQSSQWSLISSEDIYEVIPSYIDVAGTITPQVAQTIAQKNADDFRRAAFVSVFNRHPAVAQAVLYAYNSTENARTYAAIPFNTHLNDVNYYTIIDQDNLQQLSLTALLSQFNITQYGRAAQ